MKYDRLYNFISPVTGKLPIDRGYTLLGDKDGRSFSSPALIDIRQDIIDLRRRKIDTLNLPDLGAAVFPLPQIPFLPPLNIPIPNPTFNPDSLSDWVMSGPWLPQIFAGNVESDLSNPKTVVSSSLAMTQIRAAKNFKLFDNANFIVGSSTINFNWDNPAYKIESIDPKLQTILELYGLGTSYTFTKAQSLGALETGLLKNTVNNGTGTLSKAISGEDYVNTADIQVGNLVILDPLYPAANHKLIAPSNFSIRKNEQNEFGYPIANTINILTGVASSFTKLAITSLAEGSLLKIGNNFGEIVAADDINNKLDKLITFVKLLIGVKDTVDFFSITTQQASNLNKIVKTIGGVKSTIDMIDVTVSEASKITDTIKNAVGLAKTAEMAETAVKAADVFSNKAALVEMEAQIAALAGFSAIGFLSQLLIDVGLVVGGYEYGKYIRGQSLNVGNTWKSTDINDEGHNAVGNLKIRYPSGYSSDDRGHGTLWFDSHGRGNDDKAEPGLRIFSWDSGADSIGSDYPIAPVHFGIFGYQNKYNISPIPNPTPVYKGFIFRSEFHNESSSDDYYRFPKNFGLYDVKRTISTLFTQKWGFSNIDKIFEYDYNNFNFYKKVVLKEYTNFEKEVDFQKNVRFLGTGAVKIPVGTIAERPSNSELGMLRYNSNLQKIEFNNGETWISIANLNDINSLEIKEYIPEQTCIFIHKINIEL